MRCGMCLYSCGTGTVPADNPRIGPNMLSVSETASELSSAARLTPSQVIRVEESLQQILHSVPFRSSRQCQDLLKYVVRHSLAEEDNLLRERVIGNTVFGRAPDYDTANDPVVRARMAEVRKRLAQYYQGTEDEVRIEILPGHYVAHFRVPGEANSSPGVIGGLPAPGPEGADSALPPAHPALPGRRWGRILLIAAVVAALAGAVAIFLRSQLPRPARDTAFEQFWYPAIHDPMPVIIYTGTNVVYRFSPEYLDRYRRLHHLQDNGPELPVDLSSAGALDGRDLQMANNTYVSTRDVDACAAMVAMLVREGKPYELRFAGDISPGDLRSAPVVLIGAFNNSWTLEVTNSLRFTFAKGTMIRDSYDKNRSWAIHIRPDGTTTDDYAVITRLLGQGNGELTITAAGIGHYGTEAASDFLTNPDKIQAFARIAPAGWSRKNLQIVMHVKVVGDAPVSANIVAMQTW